MRSSYVGSAYLYTIGEDMRHTKLFQIKHVGIIKYNKIINKSLYILMIPIMFLQQIRKVLTKLIFKYLCYT